MSAARTAVGGKRSFSTMAVDNTTSHGDSLWGRGHLHVSRLRRDFNLTKQEPLRISKPIVSSSRSSCNSPTAVSAPNLQGAQFSRDASIVLIGMRGSGKSTLAIIASTAMKRRILDTEQVFLEATGLTSTSFKRTHGSSEYRHRQFQVLESVLSQHERDCIIVSSWMETSVQDLLRDFATSHPVVHVVRDQDAVSKYLRVTHAAKFQDLLDYSANTFRACCNYEFFNVTETLTDTGDTTMTETTAIDHGVDNNSPAPYLTLKRAERHFLRFLALIMPGNAIPYIDSAFPLASTPTEERQFTYAMSIPLSKLLSDSLQIEDLETGADAIEIVVDDAYDLRDLEVGLTSDRASQISRVFGHIRRNVVIPIIYHVLWPSQETVDHARRSVYLEYVQHGLSLAPEYTTVDVRLDDEQLARIVSSKRNSKIIGSVNLIEANPPSWSDTIWTSYYRRARSFGCDLVRMLRPAKELEDNFAISHFRSAARQLGRPHIPLIAFNTGVAGRHSQCFNKVLTSVIPESLANEVQLMSSMSLYVPPAITSVEATRTLHTSFIYDAMKLYVFGAKVGYSMSPAMHNAALKACGIPHVYRPYSTDSLSNIRELIHDPLFAGASIGLPFKVEVISLLHSLSNHAKAIGAVNTLIPVRQLSTDGSIPHNASFFNCRNQAGPVLGLYGENTDWIGIRACIRRGLSPANAVRPTSSGLVIGAGGMARAAVYAMLQLGVRNIAIHNRTAANADKLVAHFTRLLARDDLPLLSSESDAETRFHILRSRDDQWPSKFRPPTMIISCIPTHNIGDCPSPNFTLPEGWMHNPTGGVVVELAYKHLDTPLLKQVRTETHRGWVPMDGLDLLPEQGFAQFELFTGRRAPRRLMRREVLKSYPSAQAEEDPGQLQRRLEKIDEQEP